MAKKKTTKWIPSDELILAALKFRSLKLWETLNDSNIFALRQPDGTLDYCCIMGNGGTHFSLALYCAGTGINSYLATISPECDNTIIRSIMSAFFEMISCDFENASSCNYPKAEVARIREIAARNGMKVARSKGFPEFIELRNSIYNIGYRNSADSDRILTALNAAIWLAGQIDEKGVDGCGFDPEGDYIKPEGGSTIPLIIADGHGGFSLSTTVTPPYTGLNYPAPELTDTGIIDAIGKLPARDINIGIGAALLSARIANEAGFIPMVFIVVINGQIMPVMPNDLLHFPEEVTHQLADIIQEMGIRPTKIDVYDPVSQSILRDFCAKCGIELKTADHPLIFVEMIMQLMQL